ncbi:MAG TPA: M23 family metallopeptidase [Ramlibacter sp.]|jgi:murein DD-endopeptidase MepM/ murein hydrolase activator NlpD|nr:M23 family metallopeptidase [Ramlibacter sp.]
MGPPNVLFLLLAVAALLHASSGSLVLPGDGPVLAAPAAPAPGKAVPVPAATPQETLLASRRLAVPVEGVKASQLRDTFHDKRSRGRAHEAIDIMAPWGRPVLAADDGTIARITSNRGGGLTLYQLDASGKLVYYYAHLGGYADGLKEGQKVRRGEVIAYVGATGNAPATAPHLHFAVLLLSGEKKWWGGEALNPYPALVAGEGTAVAGVR